MATMTFDGQIAKIEAAFEKECDKIQVHTERMLDMVPKHDTGRRGKILDLHKLKLQKALNALNVKLEQL
jgi:hypothetical protein